MLMTSVCLYVRLSFMMRLFCHTSSMPFVTITLVRDGAPHHCLLHALSFLLVSQIDNCKFV